MATDRCANGFTFGLLLMRCRIQTPTFLFSQYFLCFVVMLHHCLFQTNFVMSWSNSEHSMIVMVMVRGHLLDDMLPQNLETHWQYVVSCIFNHLS